MSPLGQPPHPRKGRDENIPSPQTAAMFQAGFSSRSYQTRCKEMPTAGPRQPAPRSPAATHPSLALRLWRPSSVRCVNWGKSKQTALSNLPWLTGQRRTNCFALGWACRHLKRPPSARENLDLEAATSGSLLSLNHFLAVKASLSLMTFTCKGKEE